MIIDTNRRTTPYLTCLKSKGVRTIIRYYARTTKQQEKRLTRAEAEDIIAQNLSLCMVSQSSGNSASYFSKETGLQDGIYTRNHAASEIGQPDGSAIYFSVDYDADDDDVEERIIPYFKAINKSFGPSPDLPEYEIGVYGNGLVCEKLLDAGLVKYTWLSQSAGHRGHKTFKASGKWTLFQNLPSEICGLDVDVDELNSNKISFGAFSELVAPDLHALRDDAPPTAWSNLTSSGSSGEKFTDWFNQQGFKYFRPYELLVMGGRDGNSESPCYGKNTYPPEDLWENIIPTIRMLDILRDRLNAPIRITSAYRSPAYNKCIGGAGESMHMRFKALDFIAEGNSRPSDWARTLRSMRDHEGLFKGGVGLYTGFVHIDTNSPIRDW